MGAWSASMISWSIETLQVQQVTVRLTRTPSTSAL